MTATTLPMDRFWTETYLGRSLSLIPKPIRPDVVVNADNAGDGVQGLPQLWNAALDAAADDDVLVLVHDDVYVHDWFIAQHAEEAVIRWDVAGVAGAVDPDLSQPSWYWTFDPDLQRGPRQQITRSGAINHRDLVDQKVEFFGKTPAPCQLLDGVVLILAVGAVRRSGVRFDERFDFHLYDLDFSRSATAAGLRLGTWPLTLSHASAGGWDDDRFRAAAKLYLEKWAGAPQRQRRSLVTRLRRG